MHTPTDVSRTRPVRPNRDAERVGSQSSQRRGVLSRVAALVGIWTSASLLAFVLVMLAFTLFFGRNKVVLNETIYKGHRFVGQAGESQLSTQEGYGLTTFGENGLIVNKELDPDVFRVLFIGDSFVKARQVSDPFKFTELVERSWNDAHPDRPIQTLNLGLGGQDMPTFLSFGPNMDRYFEPDLVFLMVSGADMDTLINRPAQLEKVATSLAIGQKMAPLTKPETALPVQRLIDDLGFRSFFGQLQLQTYAFFASKDQPPPAEGNVPAKPASEGDDTYKLAAIATQLKALKSIWGDRLVIIYRVFVPNMGRDAPAQYSDAVTAELEKQGIPYINLYTPLLKALQERKPPMGFHNSLLGTGHWNKYGHRLVAEEVIKFLESRDGLATVPGN